MKSDSLCKKVSVSLPANVHKWLIEEAEKESQNRGSRFTVSALIQETLNELKKKKSEFSAQKSSSKPSNISPDASAEIVKPYKRSVGGSSKAGTDRSRKTG
jgi:hypothetical protein